MAGWGGRRRTLPPAASRLLAPLHLTVTSALPASRPPDITNYRIQAVPTTRGTTLTLLGTGTPVAGGLLRFNFTQRPTPGQTYSIRAAAFNALGWGPASTALVFRAPQL